MLWGRSRPGIPDDGHDRVERAFAGVTNPPQPLTTAAEAIASLVEMDAGESDIDCWQDRARPTISPRNPE